MRKSVVTAILVLLVGTVLGGTVLRLPIAYADTTAAAVFNVFVNNDSAHAVPVREQNLDANGNIKTHEQGTANVNVTNSSLPVAPAAPITAGGSAVGLSVGVGSSVFSPPAVASALSIAMTSQVGKSSSNGTGQ